VKVLALDTCLDACSAAVTEDARALCARSEPMSRGHQERLAPMVAECLADAGVRPADLDLIAVTVGPGSFTGLRVGVAFAKGLAMALDVPAVGVGTLEALAAGAGEPFVAAAVDARRDRVWLQVFCDGKAAMAPDTLLIEDAAARLAELWRGGAAAVVGSGARLLEGVLPAARLAPDAVPDPVIVARIAAAAPVPPPPLRPLYLRAPDAVVSAS
jgi:tRNA threonylcarbamoyladenosine biosynthesis protein TsaB